MPGAPARESTAVLVVVAWPHGPGLAGRVTYTPDVPRAGAEATFGVTGVDEITATVRRCLEDFARSNAGDAPVTEA